MAATEQVKDAAARMLAAGFRRSEFSCRVQRFERWRDGRRWVEYGHAVITLGAVSKERVEGLIPAILEAGLGVTEYVLADGHRYYPHVSAAYERRGKHEIVEFGEDGRVVAVREVERASGVL